MFLRSEAISFPMVAEALLWVCRRGSETETAVPFRPARRRRQFTHVPDSQSGENAPSYYPIKPRYTDVHGQEAEEEMMCTDG
jgi:hypothetical protein